MIFTCLVYLLPVINILPPNNATISRAIETLNSGGLIGMPTETVYGLGGDAANEKAIANIFALKNRPNFNPLIAHIENLDMALKYGDFSNLALLIANHFWPNPLSIVVPRKSDAKICDLACAGLETLALRAPKHKIAQSIISEFGKAICAPSANISGQISPTSALHVAQDFGNKLPIIIDGGECEIGLESTVLAIFDDEISLLRHGAIAIDAIEKIAGKKVNIISLNDENAPKSPGMLLKHYSPNAPLFLNCDKANEGEIFIGFGANDGDFNLSNTGDLTEAAANLYKYLRLADNKSPKAIKIAQIPHYGIGMAINDRLFRAAQK